nr:unnamed protein product [Callosobruchus chinensis]
MCAQFEVSNIGIRSKYYRRNNLARVDSSSPLCWSQAQEKREGWKPHFCKTTHTQNPQRNTTHRHQPRYSDLFKFFRGRTPGLIAWAVAMNKPAIAQQELHVPWSVTLETAPISLQSNDSGEVRPPALKFLIDLSIFPGRDCNKFANSS